MKKQIIDFVNTMKTNLEFDGDLQEDIILFATRQNGDVGDEGFSQIDLNDALNVKSKLLEQFKDEIKVHVETVDEWVQLTVKL